MRTVLTIAFRNLVQAKRRTLLLALAIAMVAALFLFLRSVSSSISERMVESATTLSAGHVNVGGFFKFRRRSAAPLLHERERLLKEVKEIVPEAVSIIDRHRGWGRLIGPSTSINVGVNGIQYDQEERFFKSLRMARESEYKKDGGSEVFGDFAELAKPNTVLLFAAQAKKLGVSVGDVMTFVTEASGGQANSADLRVAAIASDVGFMSNWSIFVPMETVLDLYRISPSTTGVVMVYLNDASAATAVMERLRTDLKAKGHDIMDHDPNPFFFKFEKVAGEDWLGQKLDLTIWSDEISFVLWITSALNLVSFFVVTVLSIIIVGGIINAMWMSVRERTKEIGTIRAIGAKKRFVLAMFVFEAIMLGVLASLVGTAFGVTSLFILNSIALPITSEGLRLVLMANTLQFNIHAGQVFTTVLLFGCITGLGALYPSIKAARMKPVDALMQTK